MSASPRDPHGERDPGAVLTDNPYLVRPSGGPAADEPSAAVEHVGAAECWSLLAGHELGRLALVDEDGSPDLFPVNYVVKQQRVYLRSAPGSKLRELVARPDVAFEVDGTDGSSYWSVVIRGRAVRLHTDSEIEASGVLDLRSWSPTGKQNFIRVTPSTISGRRFPRTTETLPVAGSHSS